MQRTWRERDGRFLTLQGYHATGGIRDAIAVAAAEAYANLTASDQSAANLIQLWNVSDPLEPQLIGHIATSAVPNVLALSPAGRELAMGSATDTVQVWNVSQPGRPESISHETIPNDIEETPVITTEARSSCGAQPAEGVSRA